MLEISRLDRFLFRFRLELKRIRGWLLGITCGFLIGRITNVVSDKAVKTIGDFISSFLSLRGSPFNCLSYTAIIVIIGIPVLDKLLAAHYKKKKYESKLANLVTSRADQGISPFRKGKITWGTSFSLADCPKLQDGWELAKVEVRYDGSYFCVPQHLEARYKRYIVENYETKRFFDDADKFMLVKNPIAFSDSPTIVLHVMKTKYSLSHFYRDELTITQSERDKLLAELMQGSVNFAHSLCMHSIVVTKDDRVLLTKRSPKVAYYPNTWSASVEEQLAAIDEPESAGAVLRWAKRFLREELSLFGDGYSDKNLRMLSVFIEGRFLNCSLATQFRLELTSSEVSSILEAKPRTDYEFTDWAFLSFSELISELKYPKRVLHPTSGYRILLALVHKYGIPRLAATLFGEERTKNST